VVFAAQAAVIAVLVWLIHNAHRKEIETIHGLLDLQDTQRTGDLERIDNLLRAQHAAMAAPHPDLTALIDLVDRLCQRIQAPEQAVIEHSIQQPLPDVPPTVRPDDDRGYWEALNLSKEDLAEGAMAGELNAS
jgi:hypothetical protein